MRRQVKPFVTEYRGSPRRTKDLPTSDAQQEPQAPRSRSYTDASKGFHSETSEDSYEAALRAADALFASAPSPSTVRSSPSREADTVFFRPVPDDQDGAVPFEPDPDEATSTDEFSDVVPPRRILQAIEPVNEDRFAALEAERAPKRRGRRPGSKNKPKIVVGDDWAVDFARPTAALTKAAATSAMALPARGAAKSSFDIAKFSEAADDDIAVVPDEIVDGDDDAVPRPRGRNEKFNWKRDGLRPGERWKRRLPKSAR